MPCWTNFQTWYLVDSIRADWMNLVTVHKPISLAAVLKEAFDMVPMRASVEIKSTIFLKSR